MKNLRPVSEVRSKDVPPVKGMKGCSATMPARNEEEFVSQRESLAKVNWSAENKAIN
jgi:hypothetical protein